MASPGAACSLCKCSSYRAKSRNQALGCECGHFVKDHHRKSAIVPLAPVSEPLSPSRQPISPSRLSPGAPRDAPAEQKSESYFTRPRAGKSNPPSPTSPRPASSPSAVTNPPSPKLSPSAVTSPKHTSKSPSSAKSEPPPVAEWLTNLGLQTHIELFTQEGFEETNAIANITTDDLFEMGIPEEHHTKLLEAAKALILPKVEVVAVESKSEVSDDAGARVIGCLDPMLEGKVGTVIDYIVKDNMYKVALDGKEFIVPSKFFNFLPPHPLTFAMSGFPPDVVQHMQLTSKGLFTFNPQKVGIHYVPRTKKFQVLLFIGPTGSGKSRLINYLLGKDLTISRSDVMSVTRDITACSVLRGGRKPAVEYVLVDTVGLNDTKLKNDEVLEMAAKGIKMGFKQLNTFVLVLRRGRLEPDSMIAIQQAIEWFDLDKGSRKKHVIVVITHCEGLKPEAQEKTLQDYKSHPLIGKLFHTFSVVSSSSGKKKYEATNFFCVGLPDLKDLDEELRKIYETRLAEQRFSFLYLFLKMNRPNIGATANFLQKQCTLL